MDTLNNLLNSKRSSVLGIDIGSASIKIVQLGNKKGKAVLETYGELALGPYSDTEIGRAVKLSNEKMVEAIKDVMREANVSTTDCAISIPMLSSMVSVFKMPKIQEKQFEQMVPVEARRYIPVPITEVAIDWFTVPKFEDEEVRLKDDKGAEFVEILLVAIHNDVLSNLTNIMSDAGLKTSFFEVEMFSTTRAIIESTYNYPVMIIDMGAGATKMYVVERGIMRDSHIVGRGSQDITLNISRSLGVSVDFAERLKRNFGSNETRQDDAVGEIVDLVTSPILSEANSFALNFQKKYHKNIAKVILVGGGCQIKNFVNKAQGALSLETVNGSPFSKVETPAFLEELLKVSGLSFATAIGLALRQLQEAK